MIVYLKSSEHSYSTYFLHFFLICTFAHWFTTHLICIEFLLLLWHFFYQVQIVLHKTMKLQ